MNDYKMNHFLIFQFTFDWIKRTAWMAMWDEKGYYVDCMCKLSTLRQALNKLCIYLKIFANFKIFILLLVVTTTRVIIIQYLGYALFTERDLFSFEAFNRLLALWYLDTWINQAHLLGIMYSTRENRRVAIGFI